MNHHIICVTRAYKEKHTSFRRQYAYSLSGQYAAWFCLYSNSNITKLLSLILRHKTQALYRQWHTKYILLFGLTALEWETSHVSILPHLECFLNRISITTYIYIKNTRYSSPLFILGWWYQRSINHNDSDIDDLSPWTTYPLRTILI